MPGFVRAAASRASETDRAVREIVDDLALGRGDEARLVLFFASPRHDPDVVAHALQSRAPDAVVAGCTTMGELGPQGATRGGISAVTIGAPLRAAAVQIPRLDDYTGDALPLVRDLTGQLGLAPDALDPARHCLVTLTDGLSGLDTDLVADLGTHAPGIPLVGGSAGDDYAFEVTHTALGSRALPGSAVVLLLEPGVPFIPFHTHHFHPTATRVVVTRSDPARRLIHELDGRPAVQVLSELVGVDADRLRRSETGPPHDISFGLKVAGRFFLRSVMTVRGDALLMAGAIERGTVLRFMRGGDLVAETMSGVKQAVEALGQRPAGMLLFDCGGRALFAREHGLVDGLSRVTCAYPAAGFTTYGEHYGPMLVNSTLTGLLLGAP